MSNPTMPDALTGFLAPTVVFALLLVLHAVLPARRVFGYAHPNTSQSPVRHRLNGLLVFAVALAIWAIALLAPLDWLWRVKWHAIAGAVALCVVVSTWMVLRAPADDRPRWAQWIEGRSRNVQFRSHVDAKMFLYVYGGILLALNVVAGAAHHVWQFGGALNPGVLLHTAMWVWFVADYFCFERVQLFTFDIIEERLGFKLIFGCIVVYPCLYPVACATPRRSRRPTRPAGQPRRQGEHQGPLPENRPRPAQDHRPRARNHAPGRPRRSHQRPLRQARPPGDRRPGMTRRSPKREGRPGLRANADPGDALPDVR